MKRITITILTHLIAAIAGALGFCALVASVVKRAGSDTLKDAVVSFIDILLFGYLRHPYARANPAGRNYRNYIRYTPYYTDYVRAHSTPDEEKDETNDEEDDE